MNDVLQLEEDIGVSGSEKDIGVFGSEEDIGVSFDATPAVSSAAQKQSAVRVRVSFAATPGVVSVVDTHVVNLSHAHRIRLHERRTV